MLFSAVFTMGAALLSGAAAAALPADPPSVENSCCCCDVSRAAIACTTSIKKADCVCAMAVCPKDAPVVFDN